ncbi:MULTISPECIES: dioxygenase [unclassified Microbacterium]|uniref:dioxygenase n=1 Tax=unclassified Microbacterium TaxID=2609290 RepID=UPI003016E45C
MATGAGKNRSHVEKERARLYRARQEFHAGLQNRRRRDNLVAGVAGGVLLLAIVGGQIAYFTVGPGTPAPAPSPTATTTEAPDPGPADAPDPEPTDAPGDGAPVDESPTTAP